MSAADVVKIRGCAAQAPVPADVFTDYFGNSVKENPTSPMLMVDFENTSNKPIREVEIAYLHDNQVAAVVRDVGTFTPRSVIMHAFSHGLEQSGRAGEALGA